MDILDEQCEENYLEEDSGEDTLEAGVQIVLEDSENLTFAPNDA